jgi:hypothetical protein
MAGGTVSLALKLFDSVFKCLFRIIESSSCLHIICTYIGKKKKKVIG